MPAARPRPATPATEPEQRERVGRRGGGLRHSRAGHRGLTSRSLTVDGLNRTYLIYLPAALDPSTARAVRLRPPRPDDERRRRCTSSPSTRRSPTPRASASPSRTASRVPNSLDAPWNVGSERVPGDRGRAAGQRDGRRLRLHRGHEGRRLAGPVPRRRRTSSSTGFSMGGYFAHNVGCMMTDIRAVAPHSGGTHDLSAVRQRPRAHHHLPRRQRSRRARRLRRSRPPTRPSAGRARPRRTPGRRTTAARPRPRPRPSRAASARTTTAAPRTARSRYCILQGDGALLGGGSRGRGHLLVPGVRERDAARVGVLQAVRVVTARGRGGRPCGRRGPMRIALLLDPPPERAAVDELNDWPDARVVVVSHAERAAHALGLALHTYGAGPDAVIAVRPVGDGVVDALAWEAHVAARAQVLDDDAAIEARIAEARGRSTRGASTTRTRLHSLRRAARGRARPPTRRGTRRASRASRTRAGNARGRRAAPRPRAGHLPHAPRRARDAPRARATRGRRRALAAVMARRLLAFACRRRRAHRAPDRGRRPTAFAWRSTP